MTLVPSRLAQALNIEDLRRLARRHVPAFALAYLEGGAEDQRSLEWNRRLFERWRFVPDTLVNAEQRTLATTILGRPSALPLIVAPTGFNGMLRHQADILLARAAAQAGIPFTLSTMASASIEAVAAQAPGVDLWFQLYMLKDRGITLDLLRRARDVGCKTLVFTTDCVHFGNRESERRHFRAPMKLTLPAMLETATHPAWFLDVVGRGRGVPGFGNLVSYFSAEERGRGANYVATKLDLGLSWDDLRFLRERWEGQLVVKGILHAADACQAVALGADAIVLTNHGGRQLDGSISPLEVLEEIRAACDSALDIFIDSGFRRGTDVAKALALGASAVMLGRPLLYGAAAGGAAGIEKALNIISSELDRTLAQLGVTSVTGLSRRYLRND
jgi:(S)-mandelate dehydrogenase